MILIKWQGCGKVDFITLVVITSIVILRKLLYYRRSFLLSTHYHFPDPHH